MTQFISNSKFPKPVDGEPYIVWWERFKEWLNDVKGYMTGNALAMLNHHKMSFVEFGLMVHQTDNPSSPNSRQRTWDIFGGNDPDQ